MSSATPNSQSYGHVEAKHVLQGFTVDGNTTINFNSQENGQRGALLSERETCLRSLGFLEIDSREQDISPAVEQTCDWLFDTPQYKAWRDRTDLTTNNGVLCIKGKPGAGKSTLMKHTLEQCKNDFPNDLTIAYFFNARGNTLEKSPLGMLRSIVFQLVKKDAVLYNRFLNTFREKRINSQGREWEWQPRELETFIRSAIKNCKLKPLLLLVDALDECNEPDRQHVVNFLVSLSVAAIKSGTTLRICLSRRHYPVLMIRKGLELTVEDNQEHREDIATYIRAELANKDTEIEAEIRRRANGIFMWVVLVVRLLNKKSLNVWDKKKEMRDVLEQIPGELEELFLFIFNEDDEHTAETVLMLQWVLFAQRPLEPGELYAAVAAGNPGSWNQSGEKEDYGSIRRSIENLSKGLIEIRGSDPATVQFIHLSVNDFLLRNKRLQTLEPTLEPDLVTASHARLWECCWSQLRQASSSSTKRSYKELVRTYPFLKYAADFILNHAEEVLNEGIVGQAGLEIEMWLRDRDSWFEWLKTFLITTQATDIYPSEAFSNSNMDVKLLYMLSQLYKKSLAKCILAEGGKGAQINAQGGYFGNALQTACNRANNQQIIELLLKAGADVNAQGGYFGNALQATCVVEGNQQVIELLLKAGADVNAQGGYFGNALQAACIIGGNQQVIGLLLQAGADVNAQGGYFGNALQAACNRANNQQDIELLLKAGADVNAQGGEFGNALQATCVVEGNQQVIELLLKAGADVNAQGGYFGNALQAACNRANNQQVIELLLKAGADVNAQGGYYGNALQAASYAGSQQNTELLLKAGADVNAQGGEYGSALQAAVYAGYRQIAELLLKAGAGVNAQGGEFGSALEAALHHDITDIPRRAGATHRGKHTKSEVGLLFGCCRSRR